MACDTTAEHQGFEDDLAGAAPDAEPGQDFAGPNLIVSDSPETLGTQLINTVWSGAGILYRATIPLGSNLNFRVFLWHVNKLGSDRHFRIRVRLESPGTATVTSCRFSERTAAATGNLLAIGREMACIYQYGNFDNTQPIVAITNSFTELWSGAVEDDQFIACVYEFAVAFATGSNSLVIETLYDNGGPLPNQNVVPPEDPPDSEGKIRTHVRGWWPHADGLFECGATLLTNPAASTAVEIALCESDGPERAVGAFGHQGSIVDVHGTEKGNTGLYGATARYRFTVDNSAHDVAFGVGLNVRMRNNRGVYAGVGNCLVPPGTEGLIPVLRSVGTNVTRTANLGTGAGLGVGPGQVKVITCQIAHAGAAALPVNLKLTATPPVV